MSRAAAVVITCLLLIVLGGHALPLPPTHAQDAPPPVDALPDPTPAAPSAAYGTSDRAEQAASTTGVYITTLDFLSLRAGPSTFFDRLDVLPPDTTLPAIGRSPDGRWLQVAYGGRAGWVATQFTIYSGDVSTLPVDGVDPEPFVRRANAVMYTVRATPAYRRGIDPADLVLTIPAGVYVELTARRGNSNVVQLRYQGQLYWASNVTMRQVQPGRLFDTSYLYAFGRLEQRLANDTAALRRAIGLALGLWSQMNTTGRLACNVPLTPVTLTFTQTDLLNEPLFAPAFAALSESAERANSAVSAYTDACARASADPAYTVARITITDALAAADDAARYLVIADSLRAPLARRNPLLTPGD